MKVGDEVLSYDGPLKILRVDREPQGPVPGRYTVRKESGAVIENYPGYLITTTSEKKVLTP